MGNRPTKKSDKWTRTLEDPVYSGELLLPSFGISVTRSEPTVMTHPPDRPEQYPLEEPDSSDACSVSYFGTKEEVSVADQDFLRLDLGYLRRILLRIWTARSFPSSRNTTAP